jgi:hypothetical protein
MIVSAREWTDLARPAPELRGILRRCSDAPAWLAARATAIAILAVLPRLAERLQLANAVHGTAFA